MRKSEWKEIFGQATMSSELFFSTLTNLKGNFCGIFLFVFFPDGSHRNKRLFISFHFRCLTWVWTVSFSCLTHAIYTRLYETLWDILQKSLKLNRRGCITSFLAKMWWYIKLSLRWKILVVQLSIQIPLPWR